MSDQNTTPDTTLEDDSLFEDEATDTDYFEDDYFEDDPYADLDDEYGGPKFQPIQRDQRPVGGLTDHVRHQKDKRDGAHKRAREARRKLKSYHIPRSFSNDDTDD